MATINIGKIKLTWEGTWVNTAVYQQNDAVHYQGDAWFAKIDQQAFPYNATTIYQVDDLAIDGGVIYRFINNTPTAGQQPSSSVGYWSDNRPSSTNVAYWDLMVEGSNVATTRGDLITHNGSNQVRLGIGTSGQVLTSNGTDLAFTAQKGFEGHKFLQTNYADRIADPNAVVSYGRNGRYPWLADYANNWVPTCGFPNPACGPVPWADNGTEYVYRLTAWINENHEIVVMGDDDYHWVGTNQAQAHTGATVMPFNNEFGGMRDGEYPVRIWLMYNILYVLTSEGNLFSAGENAYGSLGVGDLVDRYSLTKIATLGPDATHGGTSCQIAGFHASKITDNGGAHYVACYAIDTSGRLFAWGHNGGGKLGIGNTSNQTLPVHVTSVSQVKSISAGFESAYVIDGNEDLFIAGDNQNGVCGGINASTFTDSNQNNVFQVLNVDGHYHTTRYAHGFYLNKSGEAYGVGGNAVGSVGVGSLSAVGTWSRIGGSATYHALFSAGNAYYLVMGALGGTPAASNNDFFAWGYNANGAVGDGTATNVQAPTAPSTDVLYTNVSTSTASNTAPSQTDLPLPVTDIIKVWGMKGGQGQSTGWFFIQDNKYRIWRGGYSHAEAYFQNNANNVAIANYRMDIGPWATTSAVSVQHWAGLIEEKVVHMHGFGNAQGSEGHCVFMTDAGRVFGKLYNAQGQLADGSGSYFTHWRQLTP